MKSELLQRFIPSEFGSDPDKTRVSDLDYNFYSWKSEIRRFVEAESIPYTYICCNFFFTYLLPSLVQPGLKSPPRDKVTIFGDGTAKGCLMHCLSLWIPSALVFYHLMWLAFTFPALINLIWAILGVFVKQSDVANFTISTVDDPRTLNKTLYLRPSGNTYSMDELVEIWESKICKKLQRIFVSEEELLKKIKGGAWVFLFFLMIGVTQPFLQHSFIAT